MPSARVRDGSSRRHAASAWTSIRSDRLVEHGRVRESRDEHRPDQCAALPPASSPSSSDPRRGSRGSPPERTSSGRRHRHSGRSNASHRDVARRVGSAGRATGPDRTRRRRARRRASRAHGRARSRRVRSRRTLRRTMRSGDELSSTWPPGSNVIAEPRGSGQVSSSCVSFGDVRWASSDGVREPLELDTDEIPGGPGRKERSLISSRALSIVRDRRRAGMVYGVHQPDGHPSDALGLLERKCVCKLIWTLTRHRP